MPDFLELVSSDHVVVCRGLAAGAGIHTLHVGANPKGVLDHGIEVVLADRELGECCFEQALTHLDRGRCGVLRDLRSYVVSDILELGCKRAQTVGNPRRAGLYAHAYDVTAGV